MGKYLFIIFFLLVRFSIAGTIDPNTPDNKYIEYAQQFSSVGILTGKSEKGYDYFASAVAIDSHHVLTAAHVVKDCQTCFFLIEDSKYFVNKINYSKKYNDNLFGVGDIALCFLDKELPLKNYPELYIDNNEKNKECSIVGFGMTGTFISGIKNGDMKKRAGTNVIDDIDRELLICSPSKGKNKTQLEFLIASGDSGGGLFINGKLAGINSCVFKSQGSPDCKYGTESGHTRVSKYIDWIKECIKE